MTDIPPTDAERDRIAQRVFETYDKADPFMRVRIRTHYGSELVERGRELTNNKPPTAEETK